MNKNAIWGIIGLMSLALLGIMTMQSYWINGAISLDKKQFDKNVYAALNDVVNRLELEEYYADEYLKSRMEQLFHQEAEQFLNNNLTSIEVSMTGHKTITYDSIETNKASNERTSKITCKRTSPSGDQFLTDIECYCSNCKSQNWQIKIYKKLEIKNTVSRRALNQRIDPKYLMELIRSALSNKGINTSYDYGIYSSQKRNFILSNKNECSDDESPFLALMQSPYSVRLFPEDIVSPGFLVIQFPTKDSYIRQAVLPMIIASILFSGIIMLCFAYTLSVIFKQKKLSEIKTDFINNMTHEFKTPIATISLATDSINSPTIITSPNKIKRFAGIIKEENKRMNRQVEKVLQMALLDKKEFKLNLKPIDIHTIINKAIATISLQLEQKNGDISKTLQAVKVKITADETHISNVIHNLLDNANKYSPESPLIRIHTENINNGISIIVEDKGIGMNKEQVKRIFDKFYRVHTGNLHDVKGFGLGLSYVRAIIEAHKGEVSVVSKLGKGSRFTLFLPFDRTK